MTELGKQAAEAWRNLGRGQQVAILAIAAISVVLIIGLLSWARTPEYATAFSNLSEQDAAAIVAKLKESKTPYELANGGTTIRVPANVMYDTRLELASAGLPQGGGVGFELFNQTNFGMTDFAQKVNYQRALEGELSRTIDHLGPVEQSRVHIVIPQPTLYTDNQKEASASVVLKLRPGQHLKDNQVRGIAQLVSSSVEGLKLENITIVDANGDILSDSLASNKNSQRVSSSQLDGQRAFEVDLEQRLQGMLDRVLGPGKATVRVRALLDWDQYESSSESYSPAAKSPQVRSSHETFESYGTLPPGVGGVPGAQSNLPGYAGVVTGTRGITNSAAVTATATAQNQYTKKDTLTNYELSKVVEKTSKAPGSIKKLSVAVVLDAGAQAIAPEQMEDVSKLVSAAAGIDAARGDVLAVSSIPYNKDAFSGDVKSMEESRPVLLLLLLLLATRRGRAAELREYPPVRGLPGGSRSQLGAPAAVAAIGEADARRPVPVQSMLVEDPQKKMVREQVTALAEAQPEVMASLIKTWLQEGGR
ncbi:MAG: flagellar M-ring protein FliF [Chloroflexi bacterium]|nr:flagellar M-ring protein FliF [Chloroflexota bacterium]